MQNENQNNIFLSIYGMIGKLSQINEFFNTLVVFEINV